MFDIADDKAKATSTTKELKNCKADIKLLQETFS